ncbi:MAG: hypothetical protein C0444_04225 [Microbacterium sp.]|nr:hypothetical protein [Microbacterium sp.]
MVGWAHVDGAPLERMWLETRSGSAQVSALKRPDLPAFFDGSVDMIAAGFSVYLPGPPDVELVFRGEQNGVTYTAVVSAPRHPLPVVPSAAEGRDWDVALREAVDSAPEGSVLALGVRTHREDADLRLRAKFLGRTVVGVDIHPGIGVDVVADVHELDLVFGTESVAIVYSGSLLEHVAAPWIVARACSSVLVPGGYAVHHAPWAWPTHAQPNDFWRMSTGGLRQLFTPALGFEVVETGASTDVRMQVEPDDLAADDPRSKMLAFSTTHSAGTSWIIARRTGQQPAAATWPYAGTAAAETATHYPIDGLSEA